MIALKGKQSRLRGSRMAVAWQGIILLGWLGKASLRSDI